MGGGGGVGWGDEEGGSLGSQTPNFLHFCSPLPAVFTLPEHRSLSSGRTRLICNKGKVRHSGRNLCVLLIFLHN